MKRLIAHSFVALAAILAAANARVARADSLVASCPDPYAASDNETTGPTLGVFEITRCEADEELDVYFYFNTSGTNWPAATPGEDFVGYGFDVGQSYLHVTLGIGQYVAQVAIMPIGDLDDEGDEYVAMSLIYTGVTINSNTATLYIQD